MNNNMDILMKRLQRIAPIFIWMMSIPVYADEDSKVNVSGHFDLVSKYISRGLTNDPEDDHLAVQLGLNLEYNNVYIGYWGSTLDYSYPEFEGQKRKRKDQFEHDFILGYHNSYKDWNWDIWSATYYYPEGKNTTSTEFGLTLNREINKKTQFTTSISTYLYDVVYANQGDTYLTLQFDHQINDQWSAQVKAAASYFQDDGRYEDHELGNTQQNFAFRFASLGLSYQLFKNVSVTGEYIFGGEDRFDSKQKNLGVIGISYQF